MHRTGAILIVDDDPGICKSLAAILDKKGYQTEVAHTGEESLAMATQRFFNLALLDIRLPDMEGVELIGRLRDLHPDLVVIMVTAYASVETAVLAMNEGASAYIMKPFDMDDVLAAVDQALQKQRLIMENRKLYEGARRELAERERAEESLRKSQESYQALFSSGYDAVFVHRVADDGRPGPFTEVNDVACRRLGYTREEMLKLSPGDIDATEGGTDSASIMERLMTEGHCLFEQLHVTKDGRPIPVEINAHLFELGGEARVLSIARDVTERKRAELALEASVRFLRIANRHVGMAPLLKESLEELREVTKCAAVGIRLWNDEGTIPYQAYEGFPQAFYELESPLSVASDSCMCINVIKGETDPSKPFYTEGGSFYMNRTTRFLATASEEEIGMRRNACNRFGFESVALIPIRVADQLLGLIHVADPREHMVPRWMVGILEQVGLQLGTAIQRVSAQEQLSYAATHDPLTQLPNRQLLAELFALERARAERSGERIVLMYLDLDHFKDVNDTLGHTMGDELLRAVAGRLRRVPRTADTVARMGGDEFALAVPGAGRPQDAVKLAKRILEAVRQPFELDGLPVHITTSLGIAFYPGDGEDLDTLLRAADIAMYRAKEQGRDSFQVYRPDATLEIDSLQADGRPDSRVWPEPDSKRTDRLKGTGN